MDGRLDGSVSCLHRYTYNMCNIETIIDRCVLRAGDDRCITDQCFNFDTTKNPQYANIIIIKISHAVDINVDRK